MSHIKLILTMLVTAALENVRPFSAAVMPSVGLHLDLKVADRVLIFYGSGTEITSF
jgi:hypothetical protein